MGTTLEKDLIENRLESFIRKAEHLSSVGLLASGLARQIKASLCLLIGQTELLKHSLSSNDRTALELIMTKLEHMQGVVSRLLLLAEPQDVRMSEVDAAQTIRSVIASMEAAGQLHQIRYTLRVESDAEQRVLSSEPYLRQVVMNLLTNAVEAMPGGGDLLIDVVHLRQDKLEVRIQDSGVGMRPEQLNRLGEPFYTTKEQGRGLGLMICYKMIYTLQGELQVQSEHGKGTTVQLKLPLV